MLVKAIEIEAVPQGEMRSVALGDGPRIAIYHVGDAFHATADRCSHARALLTRGWLEGHEIVCPVHEARFDILTGKPLCFPATEPIPVYRVTLADGFVWVDVGGAEAGAAG